MGEDVTCRRVHRADLKLTVFLEQGGQREMVAAIDAFLVNPHVGLAVGCVNLAQEIPSASGRPGGPGDR